MPVEQTDKVQALTKVSLIPTAPSEKATRKVEARKMKVVAIEIIAAFPSLLIYVPAAWFASFLEDWFLYGGFVAPVQWPAVVGTWALAWAKKKFRVDRENTRPLDVLSLYVLM